MLSTKSKIIIAVIVIIITILSVTLWVTLYHPFDDDYKTVTVMLVDEFTGYEKTYNVRTNHAYLADLIEEEDWNLVYEITSPPLGYGMMINGINGTTAPQGYWVSVLSDYGGEDGQLLDKTSAYSQNYKASNGKTCYTTMLGASSFPLADGYTYVVILFD